MADGAQLGTVGSSLRLEALLVAVVKNKTDLTAYTALLAQIEKTAPEDYTVASWTALQTAIESHAVTAEQSQMTVNAAVKAIQTAYHQLVKKAEPVVYDSAGTFGPASGNETIDGDVTLVADAVILQNLVIEGQLTISEAGGDGTVTLNNVTVMGDTFVRGGGVNSIHINGGSYKTIVMEKTASGAVRIVATDATGLAVVIAEDAAGETIILEGAFDSVAVNAPELSVTTAGSATTIGRLSVGATAAVTEVTLSGVTEGENVAVTAMASYNDPQLGSEKPITVVYQIMGEDIGNYLKPDDFTTTIGVIKKDLRVVSYDSSTGIWSAPTVANELAIATELPQGFRIFAVDHDGAVFAGAGYGTIKQYGGGNTWETPFSGELLLANPVYAGVADGIALAIDPTDGKVYQITQDADTWSDSLSTINLAGREVVGAYQTAAGADCYLVLKQEGTLIQYNLTTKTELNPLIEFPTIPDGYQICGVNVTSGQLNIYLWPLS